MPIIFLLTLMFNPEINVEIQENQGRKLIKRKLDWYLLKFTVKSYPDVYQYIL